MRRELHAITKKNVHININEIKRPEPRREARRAVDRGAAREPRQLPARDEALARVGDALGCAGDQDRGRRPPDRRRDEQGEMYSEGRVPLHTIRADIDYGQAEKTTADRSASRSGSTRARSCPRAMRAPVVAPTRASATRTRRGRRRAARRPRGSAPRGKAVAGASTARASGIVPRRRRGGQRPGGGRPGAAPASRRARPARDRGARRRGTGRRGHDGARGHSEAATAAPRRPLSRRPRAGDPRAGRSRAGTGDGGRQLMLMPRKTKYRRHHRRRAGTSKARRRSSSATSAGSRSRPAGSRTADRGRADRGDEEDPAKRKVRDQPLPDKPFTKKPAETRMGSGKGSPEGWVAVVKPGVMFEMGGVPEELARGSASPRGPEAAAEDEVREAGGGSLES